MTKLLEKITTELVINRINNTLVDTSLIDAELSIPEWLVRVKNLIYTETKSNSFLLEFYQSIKQGSDLNKVKNPFMIFILQSNFSNFDAVKYPDVKKVLDDVINLYQINEPPESPKWSAATYAAWYAAGYAAESTARYAARSAAESAADAAESAATYAAYSAARSAAESAAGYAARSAAYIKFGNKLVELMKECR